MGSKIPQYAIFAVVLTLTFAACGGVEPGVVDFEINAVERALEGDQRTFVANQGDTITFTFTSDEHGRLHLHGYDLRHDVGPDAPTELSFTADATGRFVIEMHIDVPDDHEASVNDYDAYAAAADDHREFNVRPWGVGLLATPPLDLSHAVLLVAMLSAVSFDGFVETRT